MKAKAVKVFAPATIANLGAGFDILGIAIQQPGDIVYAERTLNPGLHFELRSSNSSLANNLKDNVAAHVANLLYEQHQPNFGVYLILDKRMPIGSGLGSSAASSVAAAVAVNALLNKPLKRAELLPFTMEGERKATGTAHADNVAPSLLGGACLIRSYDPLDVIQLPINNKITWVVVHPHVVVRTKEARGILPSSIPLQTAITQWGNVSGLTAGLLRGDAKLVGKCVSDVVAEPLRSKLIPGFDEVKQAAFVAGALGFSISGSGPSVFAVTPNLKVAKQVATAISRTFAKIANVKSNSYISRINLDGATVEIQKSIKLA